MRCGSELQELGAERFATELGQYIEIYAAAMNAPRIQLPGRRAIMEQHTGYPSFRAITVRAGAAGNGRSRPDGEQVIAFAYGFHGARGQWWHDLVRNALTVIHGKRTAESWTADSFEIAEVHVHPDYQAHGIGQAMMQRLTADRPERTSLLSTPDADTRARRLYRRLGFTDLLTGFNFAGTGPPYAVMGSPLPLREAPPGGTAAG